MKSSGFSWHQALAEVFLSMGFMFWRPGTENLADYWMKHHPTAHRREIRPVILNSKPRVKFSEGADFQKNLGLVARSDPRSLHPRGCVDTRYQWGYLQLACIGGGLAMTILCPGSPVTMVNRC